METCKAFFFPRFLTVSFLAATGLQPLWTCPTCMRIGWLYLAFEPLISQIQFWTSMQWNLLGDMSSSLPPGCGKPFVSSWASTSHFAIVEGIFRPWVVAMCEQPHGSHIQTTHSSPAMGPLNDHSNIRREKWSCFPKVHRTEITVGGPMQFCTHASHGATEVAVSLGC